MRVAALRPHDLAIVVDDGFVPVGEALARKGVLASGSSMIDFITQFDRLQEALNEILETGDPVRAEPRMLKAPVERPSKIWAAASNYRRGTSGLDDARGRGTASDATPREILEMAFLKPPSAVIGPEEDIIIPEAAQTIFPELELCVVIGRECRHLSKDEALAAVFGYTVILDVTARGYGSGKGLVASRCVRKGFDTFAPIGPWITTRDEIDDPQDLLMQLWVNGELTQSAKTDAMINGVAELVSYLSQVSTLYPGDLIATGNPDSPAYQRQLAAGDVLTARIERIGTMSLRVAHSGRSK